MQKCHPANASNWKVVDLFLRGSEFAGDGRERVFAGDQTGRREREWVKRDRAAAHSSRRRVLSALASWRQDLSCLSPQRGRQAPQWSKRKNCRDGAVSGRSSNPADARRRFWSILYARPLPVCSLLPRAAHGNLMKAGWRIAHRSQWMWKPSAHLGTRIATRFCPERGGARPHLAKRTTGLRAATPAMRSCQASHSASPAIRHHAY